MAVPRGNAIMSSIWCAQGSRSPQLKHCASLHTSQTPNHHISHAACMRMENWSESAAYGGYAHLTLIYILHLAADRGRNVLKSHHVTLYTA